MNIWFFQRYNVLARRGIVTPLTCPDCGFEYILGIDKNDEPVLKCTICASVLSPGLRLYEQIVNEVRKNDS